MARRMELHPLLANTSHDVAQSKRYHSHSAGEETEVWRCPRSCRFSDRVWIWTRVLSTDRKTNSKPTPTGFSAPSSHQSFPEQKGWWVLPRGVGAGVGGISQELEFLIASSNLYTEMEFSQEWTCCFPALSEPIQLEQILLSLPDALKQNQINKQ